MNKYADLLTSLRVAYQKSTGVPREKQKESIQFYLTILLNNWSHEQVIQFVSFIKGRMERDNISVFKSNAGISAVIKREDIFEKNTALVNNSGSSIPADKVLSRFDELYEINDRAMDRAVKKLFARILNAMAPETIKSGISTKGKFSFSCKTSVYSAYKNKYQRLNMYYEKGRLLRDFRTSFKKCLNEELLKAGEI